MKRAKSYMGIRGVKYRCRVRRVSSGGLDTLSQFILDHVLDKEDRISVLLQSFGLPRGVIEDALTELLEANRVSLDVLTGRLLKSAVRTDRREYLLDAPQEVWQDEFTGAILPFSMVRQFAKPEDLPEEGSVLWLRGSRARDLMDLPAARALASLQYTDSTLQTDRGGWVADGLVYPERIGSCDLCLPVEQVEVDGKTFDFVTGKGLPTWLTRSWSFELATSELSSESPEAEADQQERVRTVVEETTFSDEIGGTSGYLFKQATLRDLIDSWRGNFAKSLDQMIEFACQRNGFALEQLKDKVKEDVEDFTSRIRSSGRVRFARPETDHLRDLWKDAESYLLVAHNGFTLADLDEIWARTEGANAKAVHLILLDCSGRAASTDIESWVETCADRKPGGEVVLVRSEINIASEVSVADGREARLGSLRTLLSGSPVVIAEGRTVMQHLAASISKEISPQEAGGWWVLRQLSPALVQPVVTSAGLEKILQDFTDLKSETNTLIDDLDEKISDGTDFDTAESRGAELLDSARARKDQLELRGWEVCEQLLEEFPKQRMSIAPFSGGDLITVRRKALEIAGSEKGHEIVIILNGLPRRFAKGMFIEELRKVVEVGSALRFMVCPSAVGGESNAEVIGVLEILKQRLGAENVAIQVFNTELPSGLILDRKMVAMGWGDWFDTIAQDVGLFGFLVESEELARQISSFQSL